VKVSARAELLDFLQIKQETIGKAGAFSNVQSHGTYKGQHLPKSGSSLPKGFQVLSFYIDPESLLQRAYVFRKDGWRSSKSVYQRLISKSKIEEIRRYLRVEGRVFLNNIVATLPSDTEYKIIEPKDKDIEPNTEHAASPAQIKIPSRVNSIGLIDGQHRTYSYYEDINDDPAISSLRGKQNLLVTGIVFPETITDKDREKFEATLFKEINSKQTNVKSDLIQAIELVLDPFSDGSIATRVLEELNASNGPLENKVEQYFFDKDKVKKASVISYALKYLVRPTESGTLFEKFLDDEKDSISSRANLEVLDRYVEFCRDEINGFLSGVRCVLPNENWTTERAIKGRMLTTFKLNTMLILMRKMVASNHPTDFQNVKASLSGLKVTDFEKYNASKYNMMAQEIYVQYFGDS
jgi:DGQHR domain-containing protein